MSNLNLSWVKLMLGWVVTKNYSYNSLSALPFVGVSESEKNISEPPGLRMILFFVS